MRTFEELVIQYVVTWILSGNTSTGNAATGDGRRTDKSGLEGTLLPFYIHMINMRKLSKKVTRLYC